MSDPTPCPTFAEYAAEWTVRVRTRIRETSALVYEDHVRRFLVPRFGARPLDAIRRADVVSFTAEQLRSRGPKAVSLTLTVLRQLYYDAMDAELVVANPAARFHRHLGKIRANREPVPGQALIATLDAMRRVNRHAAWIALFLHQTGLRLGEALGLRWVDVDLEAGSVGVRRQWYSRLQREGVETKDGKRRVVPLTPTAIAVLRKFPTTTTYVFQSPVTGHPYHHGFVQRRWRAARRQLRLPEEYTPHSLRHTFGTQLVNGGVDLRVVQSLLGHADPRQTQHYTKHATPPVPAQFADALKVRKGTIPAASPASTHLASDEAQAVQRRRGTGARRGG